MIYTPLTRLALRVCFDAHKDQVDKTSLPYVFHPFHLAEQMDDEISTVCALLHDVVEDTNITLSDLEKMGFPKEATEVLSLLTHDENVPYMDYVAEIAKNPVARKVKIADLMHNSDATRVDVIDNRMKERFEKYARALDYLRNI